MESVMDLVAADLAGDGIDEGLAEENSNTTLIVLDLEKYQRCSPLSHEEFGKPFTVKEILQHKHEMAIASWRWDIDNYTQLHESPNFENMLDQLKARKTKYFLIDAFSIDQKAEDISSQVMLFSSLYGRIPPVVAPRESLNGLLVPTEEYSSRVWTKLERFTMYFGTKNIMAHHVMGWEIDEEVPADRLDMDAFRDEKWPIVADRLMLYLPQFSRTYMDHFCGLGMDWKEVKLRDMVHSQKSNPMRNFISFEGELLEANRKDQGFTVRRDIVIIMISGIKVLADNFGDRGEFKGKPLEFYLHTVSWTLQPDNAKRLNEKPSEIAAMISEFKSVDASTQESGWLAEKRKSKLNMQNGFDVWDGDWTYEEVERYWAEYGTRGNRMAGTGGEAGCCIIV